MGNGRNHRQKRKDRLGGGGGGGSVISGVPDVWRVLACKGHSRGQEAPYLSLFKLKHLIRLQPGFLRLHLTRL